MKINYLTLFAALLLYSFFLQTKLPFGDEIRKFEQADSAAAPLAKGQILLYGSSTIRLWDSCQNDFSYSNLKVINRGFGGSQCVHANQYFDRVVVPHQPKFIFFYEGDNDLWAKKSVDSVFRDYTIFIQKVRSQLPNTRLAIFSIKHSPSRDSLYAEQQELNRRLAAYIKPLRYVFFINTATPMLNADGKPRPELFKSDMLHMKREGYALWTAEVRQFYRRFR